MASCNITALNGNPSMLHGGLYRYYREAGLTEHLANDYAVADWVQTQTPGFTAQKGSIVIDPNSEPELHYGIDNGRMHDMSDEELHDHLAKDETPVYIRVLNGVKQAINAVRARPSILGYDKDKNGYEAPDDVKLFARHLSERFNVPVEFVTTDQAAELYSSKGKKYEGQPAFVAGGKAYAVESKASKVHLAHEIFGHPMLELLEQHYPEVYSALINESLRQPELVAMVKKLYPEEVDTYGNLMPDGNKELVLKAFELDAANKLDDVKAKGLKPFIRRFWDAIKKIFGIRQADTLSSISTVGDLTRLVVGDSSPNLGAYIPQKLYSSKEAAPDIKTEGATPVQSQELADRIVAEGTLHGRVTFENNKGIQDKYVDAQYPDKEITRSSQVIRVDFGMDPTAKDDFQRAQQGARTTFRNMDQDPDNPAAFVVLKGSPRQYSLTDLTYHYLRGSNDIKNNGTVGHHLVQMAFNKDPRLADELQELIKPKYAPGNSGVITQSGVPNPKEKYSFLYPDPDDPTNEGAISELQRMLSYESTSDEVIAVTEHIIYDEEWNVASRPDLTLVYPPRGNNPPEIGTVDYKFGDVEGGIASHLMKYMDVKDMGPGMESKLNLGTMKMVFGNVMLKKKIPDLKWKYMKIASIRDAANKVKLMDNYALQIYLNAISKWEAEHHSAVHQKNVEAGLYNAENYWGETLETYKVMEAWQSSESMDVGELIKDPVKALVSVTNQIIGLSAQLQALEKETKYNELKYKVGEDLRLLSHFRLQLTSRTQHGQEMLEKTDDLGHWMIWHNMNQYDITQPMLVALKDLRNEKAQIREERKIKRGKVHKQLVADICKARGITGVHAGDVFIPTKQIPYYKGDGSGLWDFLFIEQPLEDGQPGVNVRFISETRDKDAFKRLRPAEQVYVRYIAKQMGEAYDRAIGGKIVKDAFGVSLTKAKANGMAAKWDPEDAMAWVPMLHEEERERDPGVVNALNRMGKLLINAFIKDDYDTHAKEHAGLPIKYLSLPKDMRAQKAHSLNGEHIFERFMEHMDHLDLMDDVYATAKGTELMLKHYKNKGKDHYKDSLQYLEKYIIQHISVRRELEDLIGGRWADEKGKVKGISLLKALETTRILNTYATMSFQPVLAGLNATLITSLNIKHAVEQLAAKKIFGVKEVSFTPKELAQGVGDYTRLQRDIYSGNYENNKLYHILREWKWSPDSKSFVTRTRDMAYAKNMAFEPHNALFMNSLVENYGNVSILAALLRAQKVKVGGKEISLYDAYGVGEEVDADTGKRFKTLSWKGGVRGVIKMPYGESFRTEEITKLTSEEINHIKKLSARLTGDYRQDESGAAEMNAIWNMVKQFKRFMVRYFKNMAEKGELDAVLGRFIETNDTILSTTTNSKVPILEWERTFSEGWARTVLNGLGCALLMTNIPAFRKMFKYFGADPERLIEKYKWSKLKSQPMQMQNVMKGISTFLFVCLSLAAYGFFDDDDSFLATRLQRMIQDMAEGGNLTDTLRSWEKPAPAISKLKNIIQYGGEVFVSEITGDRTREGNPQGLKDLRRQFGPLASVDQIGKIIAGQ